MNPKAETVEELLARRKNLHMGMLKLAKEDLGLTLQAAIDAYTVLATPPCRLTPKFSLPIPPTAFCAPLPRLAHRAASTVVWLGVAEYV